MVDEMPIKDKYKYPKNDEEIYCEKTLCEGVKYNAGKLRWTLLPFNVLKKIVEVLDFGADKYAPDNWKKVPIEYYKDALLRHWESYDSGEFYDNDSGLSHLAHIGCNIMFLIWKEQIEHGDPTIPSDV